MSGGKGQIPETGAQRASMDHAVNLMQDYKQRWLPVQERLSQQIQEMGKPGSAARLGATGRASTDNAIAFGQTQNKVEATRTNAGAMPGTGSFDTAVTSLGGDAAKSRGLGGMMADQGVDDAYTKGLTALMATGRGEKVQVGNALANQSAMSAEQARSDAAIAEQERAGQMGLVGQMAGFGMQQGFAQLAKPSAPQSGFGSVLGGYTGSDGTRVNNPSAWPPVPGGG
jgi:hypothetical protein